MDLKDIIKKKTVIEDYTDIYEKMHGNIQKLDYDLYFDETNNIRIAKLTPNGTNADLKHLVFVLGGIALPKGKLLDKAQLYKDLKLQANVKELKFKHICPRRENFSDIIKSERLLTFLNFLEQEKAFIHFHAFHFMYWALVDIVDSLFDVNDNNQSYYFLYHEEIKSDFTQVLLFDYDYLLSILYLFSFPNIPKKFANKFIKIIYELYVENFEKCCDMTLSKNCSKVILLQVIKEKLNKEELVLLQDNQEYLICGNLENIYLQAISIFLNEKKYFDEEPTIIDKINQYQINEGKYNYCWVNSINSVEIQCSDCIIGFIEHIYRFVSEHTNEEIYNFIKGIKKDSTEYKTLYTFYDLFEKSEKFCKYFICRTVPYFIQEKFIYLFNCIKRIDYVYKLPYIPIF